MLCSYTAKPNRMYKQVADNEFYLMNFICIVSELCSGCLFKKGTGFNPYPGDCSRYVKCWVNGKNQVMGAIMTCPFGQFWDSQAMACRPSMNVWCPSGIIFINKTMF